MMGLPPRGCWLFPAARHRFQVFVCANLVTRPEAVWVEGFT